MTRSANDMSNGWQIRRARYGPSGRTINAIGLVRPPRRDLLLPDDFDDDTRIAEAVLRYHPPRAWVTC